MKDMTAPKVCGGCRQVRLADPALKRGLWGLSSVASCPYVDGGQVTRHLRQGENRSMDHLGFLLFVRPRGAPFLRGLKESANVPLVTCRTGCPVTPTGLGGGFPQAVGVCGGGIGWRVGPWVSLIILVRLSASLAFPNCGGSPPAFWEGYTAPLDMDVALITRREPAEAIFTLPPISPYGIGASRAPVMLAAGSVPG